MNERATSRLPAAVVLLTVVCGLACGRSQRPTVDDAHRALTAASVRPGVILVEAHLEHPAAEAKTGSTRLRLVVDRAVAAPGDPPRLMDDDRLAGRIELLDGEGRTLWAMGYRPADAAHAGRTFRLRAPLVDGAATVRLSEPDRELQAEAPIER